MHIRLCPPPPSTLAAGGVYLSDHSYQVSPSTPAAGGVRSPIGGATAPRFPFSVFSTILHPFLRKRAGATLEARAFFCLCCSCCTVRWRFWTRGRAASLRAWVALVAYSRCSRCALAQLLRRARALKHKIKLRCSCCAASAGALGIWRALALLSLHASSASTCLVAVVIDESFSASSGR